MSMGTFDEEEFERRERLLASTETETDDQRTTFEGRLEFSHDSVEELLSRYETIKRKR